VLPAGLGAIAAQSPVMAGAGPLTPMGETVRYIVQSDELVTAFLELEAALLH